MKTCSRGAQFHSPSWEWDLAGLMISTRRLGASSAVPNWFHGHAAWFDVWGWCRSCLQGLAVWRAPFVYAPTVVHPTYSECRLVEFDFIGGPQTTWYIFTYILHLHNKYAIFCNIYYIYMCINAYIHIYIHMYMSYNMCMSVCICICIYEI